MPNTFDNLFREEISRRAAERKAKRETGVRSLCIVLCVIAASAASTVLWGFWAGVLASSASYGLVCLFDGIESAIDG
jgi:hypothetical protein